MLLEVVMSTSLVQSFHFGVVGALLGDTDALLGDIVWKPASGFKMGNALIAGNAS